MPELECGAVTRVKVVFYAEFRRAAGVEETELEIMGQATVRDILTMIAERVPALKTVIDHVIAQEGLGSHMVVLIDRQVAMLDTPVQPGDELRLLPPISGG